MKQWVGIIIFVVIILLLILLVWMGYFFSAAYQQTVTVSKVPDNTYRYYQNKKYKIDRIKLVISYNKGKDKIVEGDILQQFLDQNLIQPYNKALIVDQKILFQNFEDPTERKVAIDREPSVENLSEFFFDKLSKLANNIGVHIVTVTVVSGDIKASYNKYAPSNYFL